LDRDYLTYMANDENVRSILNSKKEVIKKLIDIMPSTPLANVVYQNKGNFDFIDASEKWGFEKLSFSNGSSYGDLNNDGALDLVVNNVNMPVFIYENKVDTLKNRSITFDLSSNSKNTNAIGAKVFIKYGDHEKAVVENYASKGFQSSVSSSVHFGVGKHANIDSLVIEWPNGAKTTQINLKTNNKYSFKEPEHFDLVEKSQKVSEDEIFHKIPNLFDFRHRENYFIDFNKERLLPFMSNNEGPAMAMADINEDGVMDFFLGGAKGQTSTIFFSKVDGTYVKNELPFVEDISSEDTDAEFFDGDGDGDLDLFVTSGGKAFSENARDLADRYYINKGHGKYEKSEFSLPKYHHYSSSTVTTKDFDNDGDIDIFVGERLKVNCYGIPGSGYLFENKSDNKFVVSKQSAFHNLGLITDAGWVDINGDGWFDLVVTGEWMPITILINEQGTFVNKTEEYGLKESSGLWSSLKLEDIDNDGNMDIIAGNAGENNFFKNGLKMYVNDFDKNGSMEQIICHKRDNLDYPIVDRDELLSQLPYLKNKLLYFKDYEKATISSMFNENIIKESLVSEANNFKTTLFLNKKGKFSSFALPREIQYSSVKAIEIADVNQDGVKDIIFGGNQYLVKPQFGRDEASKGWLVLGSQSDNKYHFKSAQNMDIKGQIRDFRIIERKGKKILISVINNEKIQFHEIQNQ